MASLQLNLTDDDNQPKTNRDDVPKLDNKASSARESVADKSDDDEPSQKQSTLNSKSKLSIKSKSSTSMDDKKSKGHDRGQTIFSVTKIFEKGEQPKTDKYEIWAWYLYDWANSPFAGVVMALLMPLLLTDLAEEYGCSETKYGCDLKAQNLETGNMIQVSVGGWELKATSYSAAMIGIASLIQAVMYLFVGPLADYGKYRTLLFRITSIGTGIAVCCYIFFGDKSLWQFVGWWTIIGTVLLGLSIIFYNSWLPIIVETHPDIIQACKDDKISDDKLKHIIELKTDHFALVGFAWGYCAGIIVLIICLTILLFEPSTYFQSDLYGSTASSVVVRRDNDKIYSFSELWARKITSTKIYYSIFNQDNDNFIYFNGLQFIYDGIEGDLHGSNISIYNIIFNFSQGIDEIIIFNSINYNHICGLSFHSINNDTFINIGNNTQEINGNDIININKLDKDKIDNMVFGGIEGKIGESILNKSIISELSILFVDKQGQFGVNGRSTLFERIGILINGIWYLLFTIISIKYLKHRPGPPLPKGENVFFFGVKQTFKTITKIRQYPTMWKYLLSYFLFSDGLGTLISCGVLFGRELLNMTNTQLAIMILEVYIIGTSGTYLFLKIEKKFDIQSKKMLSFHLICLTVLPIWGLIGLIPGSQVGMKQLPEIYIWSFLLAIHVGSIQSFARSVFAQLIPVGHESEFFALYEVTDKGSSWLGPLIVAAVSDATDMRWAVFYIMLFFILPLPIIWYLDMDKGRMEAGRSPKQVTRRASLLFDNKSLNDLKQELSDIVKDENKLKAIDENENKKGHNMTTSAALEMAIEKNLTITAEVFEEEKP